MRKTKLTTLTAALVMACAASALAEVRIAMVGPMSGQSAAFGEQMLQGAELAVKDLNLIGGVLGEEIVLISEDDACDPTRAVTAAKKAVEDGAVFVAGHFCSGASIPASAVYAEANVLQISPGSTNPALTDDAAAKGWVNVFRVCGRDDLQGRVAGRYLANRFRDKRVAILHDGTDYGKGLADVTRASMAENGLEAAIYDSYRVGQEDFSQLLLTMKSVGVNAVYVGGYYTDAGRFISQAHKVDYRPQLVSGDALVTEGFWSIAGEAGEGTVMTFQPDPRLLASARNATERFRANGYEPEGYTLYTYAAVQVWAQAAELAGTFDVAQVSEAIHGSTFDTVLGRLSFDEKGDVKNAQYVWYIWRKGTYGELAPE